ncbi:MULTISPECIES: ABC transporter ATP-binding protein [Rhizobium/Agrobacterium group]|uniref:ABC transporter ATP-binding protein n=1 Tax=Rhizobium/Agrobacterium group TaxID=227290 RepID=UPI0022B822C9|nr:MULTISPECIES: ABC transporter ATP-binding protein [Rhizobium/Agrobacterium group]MCZ7889968.1 ABC transporter ATP-binding protein [Agrobacterium salinitolerans]MDA5636469.1 ABC transporter ATP-binding protein [Agrobacterium sp. ST15.16.024]MDF1892315.1 ABC transporter ATP-binding protein [Rhizobium rhizogenes]
MSDFTLEVRNLSKNFGALAVTNDVSLQVRPGERRALIGPNGAGKTTLINLIAGVLTPSTGQISLQGRDITGLSQSAKVRAGIGRTYQINNLFGTLSIAENVCQALRARDGGGHVVFGGGASESARRDEAMSLLRQLGIAGEANIPAAEAAYGKQRLVELAIALALKPKLLLLDEPAAGVPSSETHVILKAIESLPSDIAVIMIDHDIDLVFRFAHRVTVLEQGRVLTEGTPREIASDEQVRRIYLGEAVDA